MTTGNRAVVVTGASTGIGETTALHLAERGLTVHAGVRREEDGERLRGLDPTGRLLPLLIDVTDESSIARAQQAVAAASGDVVGLVNNAGIAVAGPVELVPLNDWRRQFEVNVLGQVAVTQAFLPALRRTRGRVVFVGSVAGRFASPGLAPYAASKHAVEAITDSLRREVRRFGMHVAVVEPGAVSTPIWDKGISDADRIEAEGDPDLLATYRPLVDALRREAGNQNAIGIAPVVVAKAIEHALTDARPRSRYPLGKDAKALIRVVRHLPSGLSDRLVARQLA